MARVALVDRDGRGDEWSWAIPSLVALTSGGQWLVGEAARRQATTNPEGTAGSLRHRLGRHTPGAPAMVQLRGTHKHLEELVGMVLARLREAADRHASAAPAAVITVPAAFTTGQRRALEAAARIGGLELGAALDEPVAAALPFHSPADPPQRIAVLHAGSGSSSLAVLDVAGCRWQVRALAGAEELGGESLDVLLARRLAGRFREAYGIDLWRDRVATARVLAAVRRARHELSRAERTELGLPFLCSDATGPRHLTETLTRASIRELARERDEALLTLWTTTLAAAGIETASIDRVLLTGGLAASPELPGLARSCFARVPETPERPEWAALTGLVRQFAAGKAEVVTAPRLGPSAAGPLGPDADVAYDGALEVTVAAENDRNSPEARVARGPRDFVRPAAGLSDAEVESLAAQAAAQRAAARRLTRLAELRGDADALIFTTERRLEEFGSLLDHELGTQVRRDLDTLRAAAEQDDESRVEAALRTLEVAAAALASEVRSVPSRGAGSGA